MPRMADYFTKMVAEFQAEMQCTSYTPSCTLHIEEQAVAAEEARSKREADQRETAARQRQLFKEVDDENTKYDAQVAGPSVVGAVLRLVG